MPPQDTNGDLSEFVISSTEIASFVYGTKPLRIWESIRNKSNARLWQFRYDPLFVPEVRENSQLAVESKPFGGGRWRTSLTVFLDAAEARQAAYVALTGTYPKEAPEIQPASVFVLPIREVSVRIPDLANIYPQSHMVDSSFDFPTPATEFTIVIESPDESTARAVEKDLSSVTIEYEFSFSARKSQQNWIKFTLKDLKSSKLFIELSGVGSSSIYVHRDDLRKLVDRITDQIDFNAVIEKPDNFEEGLLDKLLARWNTVESSKNFDDMKWQSTYNKDDLKPDVITKGLNEMFTYHQTEEQWKYNGSFSSSGKAGLFEFLSAEGSLGGSYSNEGLKKLLDQHYIKAEFEGNKIVAKSIDLRQVNISDFNQEAEFMSVKTFVEPSEKVKSEGFIDLSRVVPLQTIYPDLGVQVSKLRHDTVPVGGILPFYGSLSEAEKLREKGWWICDGRPISDPLSKLYNNKNSPNLAGRFILGSTQTGSTGGAAGFSTGARTITSYNTGGWANNQIHADPRTTIYDSQTWRTGNPKESKGTLPSFDIPTMPPYYSVIYLLKVR
jgi:hypothetical protein